jgi:DNA-directed RNA polymerase specialized sigma24 family protein
MSLQGEEPKKFNENKGNYMSLAREIAPHLPLLRRYARALTGAQPSGDAFVAATLEAIVAKPDEFPRSVEARAEREPGSIRCFTASGRAATSK